MNSTLLAFVCLVSVARAAPCSKAGAVKFLNNFNRYYPKLTELDVPHNPDMIIGCNLEGIKQFVLLYPANSSLRVSIRANVKSLTVYIEDQNISTPTMDVNWCIKSFLDLKYYMEFFNQRILKCNPSDFSITDVTSFSVGDELQKVCQGLVTDSGSGDKFKVRLDISVLGSTMSTSITYGKATAKSWADQSTVRTETA